MKIMGVLVLACIGISACSSSPPKESASITARVAGQDYVISQLTAGTWIATAAGTPELINGAPTGKGALLSAIEKASGCKVTDSDYSRQGMQLDAQVNCGSRLKN